MFARSSLLVAAVLLAASDKSSAFVTPRAPLSAASSFTQSGTVRAFAPSPSGVISSHTIMSMNLFDRFARVAKGNLNNVLKSLEDPEKIMNQAVEDMQSDLVQIRQAHAEVTATQRRLLREKKQAETMVDDWYGRAQLALRQGRDDLAKEALTKKQKYAEAADAIQKEIDAQAGSLGSLYEGMKTLEEKIVEAKSKKDEFAARAKTAQSVTKVNDMLGGLTGKTSLDAFRRMEEKVEALEAAAEASAEMGVLNSGRLLPGGAGSAETSNLEREFALLEGSKTVEEELRYMKKLLSGTQ